MKVMKTKLNQMFTIFGFFILSISGIIAICWGMNGVVHPLDNQMNQGTIKAELQIKKPKKLNKELKVLISDLRVK